MSKPLTVADRATFAAIADVLIPEAEGMPSASQVEVQGAVLDHVLALRPDLADHLVRGVRAAADPDLVAAVDALDRDDSAAFGAIGLVASAIYYMDPGVRRRLGYPGQESRPVTAQEEYDYLRDDLLQPVIDRGPIYRPTPVLTEDSN